VPEEAWGVRSIPHITTRYPLWEQEGIVARMDAGRYYLPDAPAHKRETLVTSVIDGKPLYVQQVTGPAWITIMAAVFTGGAFIFPTFHIYTPAIICGAFAIVCVLYWLWTSTARPPKEEMRDVGLGLRLPTYASGPNAVGWWAMWITMLGDATAFASLIFGFFFYWTARPDFPPAGALQPEGGWVVLMAVLMVLAWAATLFAREANARRYTLAAKLALCVAPLAAAGGAYCTYLAVAALEPTGHVYPAILWALMVWLIAHAGAGIIMQTYCLAGSLFGKLTPRYDADLRNVTLFWHFVGVKAVVVAAILGLAPGVLG
jgi:cytochrome c oxidase subunit 1/cytochrome c oxidase subunit I+III